MNRNNQKKYTLGKSKIQGSGIIATFPIKENEVIDIGIDYWLGLIPYVTQFGSWLNHCDNANTQLVYFGKYYIVTKRPIKKGEELTVNYDTAPWYVERSRSWYKKC